MLVVPNINRFFKKEKIQSINLFPVVYISNNSGLISFHSPPAKGYNNSSANRAADPKASSIRNN